jgi:gluconokinase
LKNGLGYLALDVRLVYLGGSAELIAGRQGHFILASLLDAQFATLEPPGPDENPITVGIHLPAEEIVEPISGVLFSSALSPSGSGSI